ncbi:AAA family ATPase [Sphingobacterium sp.]|uniref:AAA family ATPase n=1 Tax=Sphingobacterium sp. TaxID=341027 RepID=UPI0028996EBC|nr:AAA family ATPase [Sphingobacterium sp.]
MAKVTDKTEIRKAIAKYCEEKAISRKELSTQMGISNATISNIDNEKWDNIDEKMWQKIWNYVRPINTNALFQTKDYQTAINLCQNAKELHLMAGLIADTGMGKTTALRSFSRQENVFYIYYDANMRPNHFYHELGKQLGYDYDSTMYNMVNRACSVLNSLNDPLIIIDEAGKLTDPMLLSLHALRDKTQQNCGIVFGGMPYFKNNLIKKTNKQKVGISEFMRRIQIWNELEGLSKSEIEYICDANGITEKEDLKRFMYKKRFGDLTNEILLFKTLYR